MARHREKIRLLRQDDPDQSAASPRAKANKNCLFCKRFSNCRDPKKNWRYICERFAKIKPTSDNPDTQKLQQLNIVPVRSKLQQVEENSQVNFEALIDKALERENRSPLPPDMRIDDSDIPLAPNFFTFATSKSFLDIKPYAKQIEAALHLFAEWCPFCSNPDYIWDIPRKADYSDILENIQMLEFGVCPKCKVRKSELLRNKDIKIPVELAGLAGQRSGKSAGSVMYATYTLHGYLKLQNASKAFNLLDTDTLDGTFVAQTWQKAKDKLYAPLYNYLTTKPWFMQFNQMLDYHGDKYGERLYRINEVFVNYRIRNLAIKPAGPDKRKLRGDTSFVGIIDELGWFDSAEGSEKKVKQSASEIYTAMRNAFRTLRSGYYRMLKRGYDSMPAPIFCNISSPSSKKDQMVKNYERSQKSKYVHGFHYCVAGNTVLITAKGLQRIDQLAESTKNTTKSINLQVAGENGPVVAGEWHKTGKKTMLAITIKSGHTITVSRKHTVKVLRNNAHAWIKANNLHIDDLLVINTQPLTRSTKLQLNLPSFSDMVADSSRPELFNSVTQPKIMTPNLASLMAAVIAEGHMTTKAVWIANANTKYLEYLSNCAENSFKLTPNIYLHAKQGTEFIRNGIVYRNNYDLWKLYLGSKIIVSWLQNLGISYNTSEAKYIPWSIQQADSTSQLAFIASYIESDGWIEEDATRIGIGSKSHKLLQQLQIMLNSHGIMTCINKTALLTASERESYNLYNMIEPYLVSKQRSISIRSRAARNHGIPFGPTQKFFKSKKIGVGSTDCLSDNGKSIKLTSTYYERNCIFNHDNRKLLSYDEYEQGRYDAMLNDLALISPSEHARLKQLLTERNWYSPIVTINNIGKKSSYDLTIIKPGTPAFAANAVIVHNSSWEFNPTLNKSDFADDFANDAAKAWRDFGAVPPNSSMPYISDLLHLKGIVKRDLFNTVSVTPKFILSGAKRTMQTGKLRFNVQDDNKRIAAIDAGYNHNSFAMVAGFMDEATQHPVLDTFIELQPTENYPLNHNAIFEDIICPLIERLNIKMLVSDRWQNIKLLQDAEAMFDIPTEPYSVKYGDFEAVRQDVYTNYITIPKPEMKPREIELAGEDNYPRGFIKSPIAHLLYQFITVNDIGKSVEKGDGGTDDLLRALVLCYSFITDEDYAEFCIGKIGAARSNNPFIGVMGSRGGGGMGAGQTGTAFSGSNGPIGLIASFGSGNR